MTVTFERWVNFVYEAMKGCDGTRFWEICVDSRLMLFSSGIWLMGLIYSYINTAKTKTRAILGKGVMCICLLSHTHYI